MQASEYGAGRGIESNLLIFNMFFGWCDAALAGLYRTHCYVLVPRAV